MSENFYEVPDEPSRSDFVLKKPVLNEKDYSKDTDGTPGVLDGKGKDDPYSALSLSRAQLNNRTGGKRLEVVKESQNKDVSVKQLTHVTDPGSREISDFIPNFTNVSISARFHLIIQQLGIVPSLDYPMIIGVTSSVRGEGRTTIALGLANAISQQTSLPVLLVEADIDHPTLATDLNMTNLGLCEYLRSELPIHCETLNDLFIMFAGEANGQALKTLRSSKLEDLFVELTRQYAVIVVDLPPLAGIAESSRLIHHVDKVLMVVQASITPARLVRSALGLIPEEKRSAVVLNRTRPAFGPFRWLSKLFH